MPIIGEIVHGKDIGKTNKTRYQRYIWHACFICGTERWVQLEKGQPSHSLCLKCSKKERGFTHTAERSTNWKGGRLLHKRDGYIYILVTNEDFFASMRNAIGYVREHRLVMAKHLGRCLQSWEIIHHRNGIKDDNRIENLQLVTEGQHNQITLLENRIVFLEKRVTQLEVENILLRKSDQTEKIGG